MKINPAPDSHVPFCPVRCSLSNGVNIERAKASSGFSHTIFKAYDIRGIYPTEINEEAAYKIGRAFVQFLSKFIRHPKIVVGRDNRISSPALFRALIKGITAQKSDVVNIGLSTSPMLYFAAAHYEYDGGVQITASHNSFQYNGFKLVRKKAIPISEKTGLRTIQQLTRKLQGHSLCNLGCQGSRGRIIKKEILKDYLNFNFRETETWKLKPFKIVIDTANAVPGILIPDLEKRMPGKIYSLFKNLDGNFPNHNPDPLVKENLKFLQEEIKRKKADLGIAFDGDGDRIVFLDEKGNIISGDLICALISDLILKKNPGSKILYDIRSSNVLKETIEKARGIPLIGRVGHSFIKERMRKENILFAGEFSSHYYHRDHYFCEAPLFVLFRILEELSQTGKKFSETIKPFRKYFHSGEINFKVRDKMEILKKLEGSFGTRKILKIDGLRIDFKDWWFSVRPSNTEPLLRLVIEAKTKKLMEKKKKEISKLIQNIY